MKTREEIEQEYRKQIDAVLERHMNIHQALIRDEVSELNVLAAARDAALAELDDPMERLSAGKRWLEKHGDCSYEPCIELCDAVDYAEQRRAQA
jgi:hypothetical protein